MMEKKERIRKQLKTVTTIDDCIQLINSCHKIIVVTGAGISVSCGIPDFRSKDVGLYHNLDCGHYNIPSAELLFDLEFFLIDPQPFYKFCHQLIPSYYNSCSNSNTDSNSSNSAINNSNGNSALISSSGNCSGSSGSIVVNSTNNSVQVSQSCIHHNSDSDSGSNSSTVVRDTPISSSYSCNNKKVVEPSLSHYFIHLLEQKNKLLRNYTQNIDGLERVAGVTKVVECHGTMNTFHCTRKNCNKINMNKSTKASQKNTSIDGQTNHRSTRSRVVRVSEDLELDLDSTDEVSNNVVDAKITDESNGHSVKTDVEIGNSDGKSGVPLASLMRKIQDGEVCYCNCGNVLKPAITFFGEKLPKAFSQSLGEDLKQCDLVIVIGTSLKVGGSVYQILSKMKKKVPQININRELIQPPKSFSEGFDVSLLGNCDDVLRYICQRNQWEMDYWKNSYHNNESNGNTADRLISSIDTINYSVKLQEERVWQIEPIDTTGTVACGSVITVSVADTPVIQHIIEGTHARKVSKSKKKGERVGNKRKREAQKEAIVVAMDDKKRKKTLKAKKLKIENQSARKRKLITRKSIKKKNRSQ